MKRYGIFKFWVVLKEKVFRKNKNKNKGTTEGKKENISKVIKTEKILPMNEEEEITEVITHIEASQTNEVNMVLCEMSEEKYLVGENAENRKELETENLPQDRGVFDVTDKVNSQKEEHGEEITLEEVTSVERTHDDKNLDDEIPDDEIHDDDDESHDDEVHSDEVCDEKTYNEEIHEEQTDEESKDFEQALIRKEKELVYNNEVELTQKKVDEKYLSHLKEVPEVDNYSKLRNRIVKEFPDIKLLCEIEINDDEYKLLCAYFRKKYMHIRRDIGHSVVDIIFSVALVQIGIRNYDGNFWKQVDDVMGIKVPLTHRAWIGGTLSDTLVAFGKPLYSNQEYVTNILMHCFVTQSFLIRMYDYLFQYYNLDLQRDMVGMNEADMDFLCSSIKNPFGMRKQLLSNYTALSIKKNEDYCKNILYNALRLIDMSFWNEYSEDVVLPERFQSEFEEWKKVSSFYKNEQKRMEEVLLSGTREKVYRKPHLKCHLEKGVFEVVLPPQMVRESKENEYPTLTWQIFSLKTSRELKCSLEEGYSGYKTKELKIELEPEEIFGEIQFLLFKDNDLLRKFSWAKHKINFFDESGNWISGVSLEAGNYFGFTEIETNVISDALLATSIRNDMKFWEFNFAAGDLVQICGETSYYIGDVPNTGLTNEYLLKDVIVFTEQEEKVSVYNKLPSYVIDISVKQFNGTAIYVNGKIERLSEKDFVDVCNAKNDEKKYYFLNLHGLENIRTGFNEIVIDIPGSTRKLQERFVYIPDFHYMFEDAPYVFQKRGTLSLNRKITKGIITDVVCEMQNYDFAIDDLNSEYLEFPIIFDNVKYKMAIRIPVFMYSWDMNNWNVYKSEDIWHTELQSYIYIKYPANRISLGVSGRGDTLQATYVYNKDVHGIFVCDLTKLKSYFYDGTITKKIMLITDAVEYDILRIITKSYLHNVILEVDYEKDYVAWKFDISGKNTYYADIFYKDECLIEKEVITEGKIETKIPIHSAKYLVKVFESEDEFGFDEEYDFVGQSETTVLNPMELTNSCMKLNVITEIENPKNVLEVNYSYYIFISGADEDMDNDKHYYTGILAGVFHNSVMCASKVKIYIPNLNDIYHVVISFVDEYGDNCDFLYDSYTNSISECENSRFTKSEAYRRYEMLYTDMFVWDVKYVSNNTELEKKAQSWIEIHNKKRTKDFWKSDNYEFKKDSIDELELSLRSYNCLKRAGLITVEQVVAAYQKGNLMKIRNFGRKNYEEVYSKLCKRNLI